MRQNVKINDYEDDDMNFIEKVNNEYKNKLVTTSPYEVRGIIKYMSTRKAPETTES